MKYAVEIGSGTMIYAPNFIKIGSSIQTLGDDIQTHRQHSDRISLLSFFFFFKRKEVISARSQRPTIRAQMRKEIGNRCTTTFLRGDFLYDVTCSHKQNCVNFSFIAEVKSDGAIPPFHRMSSCHSA
jgi:hypothetical protein